MASHLQHEFASRSDIGVCKPRLVPVFAIEGGGLYVFVLRRDMVRFHGKNFAVAHCDAAACEDGTSDLVDRAPGAFWVEPKGAKDIPGRGLSSIVVAGNPERAISIPHVQQVIEIGDVEARLVALRIQPHETGGVRKLAKEVKLRGTVLFDKELVQPSTNNANRILLAVSSGPCFLLFTFPSPSHY